MASSLKNLSAYDAEKLSSAHGLRFAILVSEWNEEITDALCMGAFNTLIENKVLEDDISILHVPGSFELPFAAARIIKKKRVDAVICIGCVIQGETRHFEFISQAVAQGIMNVGLSTDIPVVFGVLTTDTLEQAKDRAGGKHGNKGVEAAVAALRMASFPPPNKDRHAQRHSKNL
ncbi:MAG: 6,7-dimethyl-8-ribityllumazine synthase [Bacteroidota bacterium]